jgi:Fe2+ transport system protein FeoA
VDFVDGRALSMNDINSENLWNLNSGQTARLIGFAKNLDPRYRERIEELGFRPNTEVSCIKAPAFGAPKVYRVNNSVFCLEDSIAALLVTAPVQDAISTLVFTEPVAV